MSEEEKLSKKGGDVIKQESYLTDLLNVAPGGQYGENLRERLIEAIKKYAKNEKLTVEGYNFAEAMNPENCLAEIAFFQQLCLEANQFLGEETHSTAEKRQALMTVLNVLAIYADQKLKPTELQEGEAHFVDKKRLNVCFASLVSELRGFLANKKQTPQSSLPIYALQAAPEIKGGKPSQLQDNGYFKAELALNQLDSATWTVPTDNDMACVYAALYQTFLLLVKNNSEFILLNTEIPFNGAMKKAVDLGLNVKGLRAFAVSQAEGYLADMFADQQQFLHYYFAQVDKDDQNPARKAALIAYFSKQEDDSKHFGVAYQKPSYSVAATDLVPTLQGIADFKCRTLTDRSRAVPAEGWPQQFIAMHEYCQLVGGDEQNTTEHSPLNLKLGAIQEYLSSPADKQRYRQLVENSNENGYVQELPNDADLVQLIEGVEQLSQLFYATLLPSSSLEPFNQEELKKKWVNLLTSPLMSDCKIATDPPPPLQHLSFLLPVMQRRLRHIHDFQLNNKSSDASGRLRKAFPLSAKKLTETERFFHIKNDLVQQYYAQYEQTSCFVRHNLALLSLFSGKLKDDDKQISLEHHEKYWQLCDTTVKGLQKKIEEDKAKIGKQIPFSDFFVQVEQEIQSWQQKVAFHQQALQLAKEVQTESGTYKRAQLIEQCRRYQAFLEQKKEGSSLLPRIESRYQQLLQQFSDSETWQARIAAQQDPKQKRLLLQQFNQQLVLKTQPLPYTGWRLFVAKIWAKFSWLGAQQPLDHQQQALAKQQVAVVYKQLGLEESYLKAQGVTGATLYEQQQNWLKQLHKGERSLQAEQSEKEALTEEKSWLLQQLEASTVKPVVENKNTKQNGSAVTPGATAQQQAPRPAKTHQKPTVATVLQQLSQLEGIALLKQAQEFFAADKWLAIDHTAADLTHFAAVMANMQVAYQQLPEAERETFEDLPIEVQLGLKDSLTEEQVNTVLTLFADVDSPEVPASPQTLSQFVASLQERDDESLKEFWAGHRDGPVALRIEQPLQPEQQQRLRDAFKTLAERMQKVFTDPVDFQRHIANFTVTFSLQPDLLTEEEVDVIDDMLKTAGDKDTSANEPSVVESNVDISPVECSDAVEDSNTVWQLLQEYIPKELFAKQQQPKGAQLLPLLQRAHDNFAAAKTELTAEQRQYKDCIAELVDLQAAAKQLEQRIKAADNVQYRDTGSWSSFATSTWAYMTDVYNHGSLLSYEQAAFTEKCRQAEISLVKLGEDACLELKELTVNLADAYQAISNNEVINSEASAPSPQLKHATRAKYNKEQIERNQNRLSQLSMRASAVTSSVKSVQTPLRQQQQPDNHVRRASVGSDSTVNSQLTASTLSSQSCDSEERNRSHSFKQN